MFRLNTYDFDESLVFTGIGARKNNYLIETYLANEREQKKWIRYSKMEPQQFNNFIEDRRLTQLEKFYNFCEVKEESELFKSIVEANINYNAYADKEIYPFAYFGNNNLSMMKDLPKDFYAHRATIDYDAVTLNHLYSYNRFLFSHIDNLAAHAYYDNNPYGSRFDRHTMHYNKVKLDLIDSIISNETIKNSLLKYKTTDYVSHNHTEAEAYEMLDYFLSKSTSKEDKARMKELVSSLKLLRQGNPIPNLSIIDYNDNEYDLNSIISRPTIIYFWSSNSRVQYRNSHYKVKNLKHQFPDVDFLSINLNNNDDLSWRNIIDSYNFPKDKEFRFKNPLKARKVLAVNYMNKAIIVDEDATILHPNVSIFKSNFAETLSHLLQKDKEQLIAKN
jgi:hypothetical protein